MLSPGSAFLPVMAASSSKEGSVPGGNTILSHRMRLPRQRIWNRLPLVVDESDVASRTSKKTKRKGQVNVETQYSYHLFMLIERLTYSQRGVRAEAAISPEKFIKIA